MNSMISNLRLNRAFRSALALFIVIAYDWQLPAQQSHDAARKGDRFYDLERYGDATQQYKEALNSALNDPKLLYNLGSAQYMEGKCEEARKSLERALPDIKEPGARADAFHNLGNTFMHLNKFKEAVEAYENSLRLRPGDPDTKTNLQLAKKKRREQQQKEKEKEQQQQQQQNQQDNQSQQEQNQQDKQNQQQQNQKDNQNQQQPPKSGQNQQPKPDQQNQQQQQPGKMTQQEAQKFLETAISREDQKNARKYRELQKNAHPKGSKKDW